MTIGAAHVALADKGPAIVAGSDRPLTFGGRTTATIPAGAPVLSDPIELAVAPLGSLAISLFLPDVTPVTTWHKFDAATNGVLGCRCRRDVGGGCAEGQFPAGCGADSE